jgi:hypothetical protein
LKEADKHQIKRKTGKLDIEDDSLLNELNFCFSDDAAIESFKHLD